MKLTQFRTGIAFMSLQVEHLLTMENVIEKGAWSVSEMAEKAPLRVVVTGAAGQIAYSLLYQVI